MEGNVRVIFISGLLTAFVTGVFELLFPFYLDNLGVSLIGMGLIFSISTLFVSFLRIFLGEYADVYGRKKVYIASCALGVASKGMFPFSVAEFSILVNKFLSDLQESLRVSVHNIMLFDNARRAYVKLFSWFTAADFVFHALGTLSFALLLAYLGYSGFFFLLAGVEVAKLFAIVAYREERRDKIDRKISLRDAYSFRLGKNLRVLSLSSAVGALGFGIAHGFLLPLYFVGKYGLDTTQISIITAVHRLSFLTTPSASFLIKRLGLRRTYILSTLAYAVSFLGVGLITFPIVIFVPIFLLHDLLGGGIRMTVMTVITQNLAAEDTRARDVNAFNAIQTPMTIIAPSIAGMLAAANWDYIFTAGGFLYVVSLAVFCMFFKTTSKEEDAGTL